MQVNKSLLKKCLAAICCICLTLACVFGVAACGGDTTVKDVRAENNKITVELTDGTKHESLSMELLRRRRRTAL